MSQISRLHSTEIANGNLIDATHLNNEFNQLVSESNSQDSRLTSAETTLTNHTDSIKSAVSGLQVYYNTANQVIIKPGRCRDSNNTALMQVSSDITVDIAVSGSTSGNCLDTGTEAANSWYYLWLIGKTDGTTAGLLSLSSSSPTMPTGFTLKRLIGAVRNDSSSNFIKFYQSGNGSLRDYFWDDLFGVASGLSPTAGTWTTLDISSSVPVGITRWAWLQIFHRHSSASTSSNSPIAKIRPNGSSSSNGMLQSIIIGTTTGNFDADTVSGLVYTDANGVVEHTRSVSDNNVYSIYSFGFRIEI